MKFETECATFRPAYTGLYHALAVYLLSTLILGEMDNIISSSKTFKADVGRLFCQLPLLTVTDRFCLIPARWCLFFSADCFVNCGKASTNRC